MNVFQGKNILIALDKFKGSLTAFEGCSQLAQGLRDVCPSFEITVVPMADGGDGSLDILDFHLHLKAIKVEVNDPLMRKVSTCYMRKGKVAYVEMAAASGLNLLSDDEKNCMVTSSYGTGELMAHAIQNDAETINLFIGGSATNDGGMGIASALGFEFKDTSGRPILPIGKNLGLVKAIGQSEFLKNRNILINVICDVNNPFYGTNGAAHVYAAQKGASKDDILQLDKGLKSFAEVLVSGGYSDISNINGAGAAGGVGGGVMSLMNGKIKSGIQFFMKITGLEEKVKNCDLVITGEGNIDTQSQKGKVISGVLKLTQKYDKYVIGVCGKSDVLVSDSLGFNRIYSVMEKSQNMEDAMSNASIKLREIGREIAIDMFDK